MGPGDPVVVPVTGGGFEARLRSGVWEATVMRGEETWAAPVRVPVGGDASLTLDLPRRVPVEVRAEALPEERTLLLEPLDPAARAASVLLEPGAGPWEADLVPGTYRVTLARDPGFTDIESAVRVARSLSVVDAPERVEVETVQVAARISGRFLDDPWAWLRFERVDDGLTEQVWPAPLGVQVPTLLTPGTYRVRLFGTVRDAAGSGSCTVRAVLDPAFEVEAGATVEAEFSVDLREESFVADVPVGGRCEAAWSLRSPQAGHEVEASGPCSGVPVLLPSGGPWQAGVTPSLNYDWNAAAVDLGEVDGGGRYEVPVHRLGLTVTLDGTPLPGEGNGYLFTLPAPEGSFENWLTPGAYRIVYRPLVAGAPPGWHVLQERFELTAAQDVTLELGPAVEVAFQGSRNGVPLSSQELPRLSVVDERDATHYAGAQATLVPGRYRVVAAGDYGSEDTWPREAVVLEAPVEVGSETPRVEVPLALDVAELAGTVRVNGVAQSVPLRFEQPTPPRVVARPGVAVDEGGGFSKTVWGVPGVLVVDGQPLRCGEVGWVER